MSAPPCGDRSVCCKPQSLDQAMSRHPSQSQEHAHSLFVLPVSCASSALHLRGRLPWFENQGPLCCPDPAPPYPNVFQRTFPPREQLWWSAWHLPREELTALHALRRLSL